MRFAFAVPQHYICLVNEIKNRTSFLTGAHFFQHDIDQNTRLAVWEITEDETFFNVPLQRSITHPHKRLQHLAGRYLLRYLFPDFPLDLILVADTCKPYLENEDFHFSISHCGDYAAAIVSRDKRVGIDIEIPSGKVLRIRHKFLHGEEQRMLQKWHHLPEMEKATLLWSAKEAMFKWWGRGAVDFSEMLRVRNGSVVGANPLQAAFVRSGADIPLNIHFQIFAQMILTWVCEPADGAAIDAGTTGR